MEVREEQKEQEVGVQEEGKPAAEKPAEEPASKPTEQADDGVVMVDVTKKYASRRNPEGVPGDELWAGYGRGQLYDKAQSENQKLQADNATKDDEIATLRAQVTASATKLQVDQRVEELNMALGQKPVASDDNFFESGEPSPTVAPRITASQIQEKVEQTAKDFLADLVPGIKEAVIGAGQQQREEEAAQVQRQQTVNILRANELANLQVEFPDANESELNELANLSIQQVGHLSSAVDKHNAGDATGGNDALFDGQDVMKAMVKKRGELAAKQTAITTQREKDAELEGINAGILPGEEPEEEQKKTYDWHEGDKKRLSRLEKAKKFMTRQETLKNSGM